MPKQLNILLVDDEKEFLDSISERVKIKGYSVFTALSGEEALKIAAREKIHAAVVDLKMPGMSGLETIERLKGTVPGIQTVLLTGFGDEKVREATNALDSDYFEKDEMDGFWGFLRSLKTRLEDTMAAAGMATHGDIDDAFKIDHEHDPKTKGRKGGA